MMGNRVPKITEMTLREKVEQTMVVMVEKKKRFDFTPGAAFLFGQIITQADDTGIAELREYVDELYAGCKIPPLITSDFENGCGGMIKGLTPFPLMMGLGASNDEKLAYDYGKATALEARSVGANWTFSPVSDLNMNPRNPLINNRGMTDDAGLACRMLPEIVKGMQENGLSACAKHFPGDGVDYRDQHITTTVNSLSLEEWYDTFGKLYREVIAAGVDSIMAGHIALPAYPQKLSERFEQPLPATLNRFLITNLLKEELGFEGIVVTDALNMGGFHGWYDTHEEAEIESFKAGCDMLLWPSASYADNLEKAVLSGEVSMERLDDAVCRILRVKEKAGLFDEHHERFRDMTSDEQRFVKDVQKRCSDQSITLVRDKQRHFPLSVDKTKKVGIVVLKEFDALLSEISGIKEAFEARGFHVQYFDGEQFEDDERCRFYEENDVVIYALLSRPFRPIGFIDYTQGRAWQIAKAFMSPYAIDKNIFVSFGSPYFGNQYLENALTYVNAYAPLECVVNSFVKAACGEIDFMGISPVKL